MLGEQTSLKSARGISLSLSEESSHSSQHLRRRRRRSRILFGILNVRGDLRVVLITDARTYNTRSSKDPVERLLPLENQRCGCRSCLQEFSQPCQRIAKRYGSPYWSSLRWYDTRAWALLA